MNYFLLLITACCINLSFAQDSTATDSDYVYYIPNTFYPDAPGSFLVWQGEQPESFAFRLFDQWGNEVFCEEQNLLFQFDDTICQAYKDLSPHLMELVVMMPDERTFTIRKQLVYISYYCAG